MTVTRTVPAPAAEIFSLITRASGHVAMDGSGMLVGAVEDKQLSGVGDSFTMNMDRAPLGDFPDMSTYQVVVTAVAFEHDRLLEWDISSVDLGVRFRYFYGIQLTPISENETLVENCVDWSGVPDQHQHRYPVVPQALMEASLVRLEAALRPTRMTIARTIPASAAAIFDFITRASGHAAMDGSGMLIGPPEDVQVHAVDQTFRMNMDREPLGDIDMGKYQVIITVSQFEHDRLLEWKVSTDEHPRYFRHRYGIALSPVSESATLVENYVDWSQVPEQHQSRYPVVPRQMMEPTLVRLEAAVTDR